MPMRAGTGEQGVFEHVDRRAELLPEGGSPQGIAHKSDSFSHLKNSFSCRCLKLSRLWSEAMNSVRFLHLSTTARRNSPYSNPFSQTKAKTVTGREEWRGVRDGSLRVVPCYPVNPTTSVPPHAELLR